MREFSAISSNWRSEQVTDEYMERYAVPVLAEIDTRALVRHLRTNGVMRGVMSTQETNADVLVQRARSIRKMDGTDLARVVSTKSVYSFDADDSRNQSGDPLLTPASDRPLLHVVAYDFGIKQNILRMLTREGCRVTVVPAETTAAEVLGLKPDGVFLSNGPGDPEPVDYAVQSDSRHDGTRAGIRDLSRSSALRACAGRQDLQAEIRASRRQSSCAQQYDGQGRDHGAQSQLRRRSGVDQRQRS